MQTEKVDMHAHLTLENQVTTGWHAAPINQVHQVRPAIHIANE